MIVSQIRRTFMKLKKFVLVLSIVILGVGADWSNIANASGWKKGTPHAIRGTWSNNKENGWTTFFVTKKKFGVGHMGMSSVMVNHPHYIKTTSGYTLKGYAPKNGNWNGGHVQYKVTKNGKHIHIKSTKNVYDNVTLKKIK